MRTEEHDGTRPSVAVLTPHSAPGAGPEFGLMAGGLHTQVRLTVAEPPRSRRELHRAARPGVLDAAFATLGGAYPEVVALASSSTSYALGHRREAGLLRSLSARWGLPVVASGDASVAALRCHAVERISLVFPPWFGSALTRLGARYYLRQGITVVAEHVADLPQNPVRVTTEQVVDQVSRSVGSREQAVVLAGNGLRAAAAITELEERTGRLVVEANQALLWDALGRLGRASEVHGFGQLFDTDPGEKENRHA